MPGRECELRFRTFAEPANDAVIVADDDGRESNATTEAN